MKWRPYIYTYQNVCKLMKSWNSTRHNFTLGLHVLGVLYCGRAYVATRGSLWFVHVGKSLPGQIADLESKEIEYLWGYICSQVGFIGTGVIYLDRVLFFVAVEQNMRQIIIIYIFYYLDFKFLLSHLLGQFESHITHTWTG